jgi:hypothetical protein
MKQKILSNLLERKIFYFHKRNNVPKKEKAKRIQKISLFRLIQVPKL